MNFKNNETIYSQIADSVKKRIFSGALACGTRLPAIRDFAVLCQVNPNTIVRVYQLLADEGLIYTDSTNGKFVVNDRDYLRRKRAEYLRRRTGEFVAEVREAGMNEQEFLALAQQIFTQANGEDKQHE